PYCTGHVRDSEVHGGQARRHGLPRPCRDSAVRFTGGCHQDGNGTPPRGYVGGDLQRLHHCWILPHVEPEGFCGPEREGRSVDRLLGQHGQHHETSPVFLHEVGWQVG